MGVMNKQKGVLLENINEINSNIEKDSRQPSHAEKDFLENLIDDPFADIEQPPSIENIDTKPNPKPKKQVFSFRAALDNIADWKAYATATKQTMETIGTAAMNEYLEHHKLTGDEQAAFEAIKKIERNARL